MEVKDYVLGKFNQEEKNVFNELVKTTDNIINDYLTTNFDKLMGKYNGIGNTNTNKKENLDKENKNNNTNNGD